MYSAMMVQRLNKIYLPSTHNKNTKINNQKGSFDIEEEIVYQKVPEYLQ